MMGWCSDMAGWGGHRLGGLFLLLAGVLITLGIVAMVRWFSSRSGNGKSAALESPLEILKRRYARGEIDKAEFEEKRKDILGS